MARVDIRAVVAQARRKQTQTRWKHVQTSIRSVVAESWFPVSSAGHPAVQQIDRYVDLFRRLEQVYNGFVMQGILRFYALLEAERGYIEESAQMEELKCLDLLKQTKLLYQFKCVRLLHSLLRSDGCI